MKLLLSDRFKIAIHVGNADRHGVLTVYAIELRTGAAHTVFDSDRINSKDVFEAIERAVSPSAAEQQPAINHHLLLHHMEQYRNNIYGFHLSKDEKAGSSNVSFFFEQYIRRFSIEIACSLDLASVDQIELLEKEIANEASNVGRDYEDNLELKCFYETWKAVSK